MQINRKNLCFYCSQVDEMLYVSGENLGKNMFNKNINFIGLIFKRNAKHPL